MKMLWKKYGEEKLREKKMWRKKLKLINYFFILLQIYFTYLIFRYKD